MYPNLMVFDWPYPTFSGSCAQNRSDETGPCLPFHNREHCGRADRRKGRDETSSGQHRHSAG